jgi:hypothetical protein
MQSNTSWELGSAILGAIPAHEAISEQLALVAAAAAAAAAVVVVVVVGAVALTSGQRRGHYISPFGPRHGDKFFV